MQWVFQSKHEQKTEFGDVVKLRGIMEVVFLTTIVVTADSSSLSGFFLF